MTKNKFPDRNSELHPYCCLASECIDEGCELNIEGWPVPPLTVIGGTQYQSNHTHEGPLCDFTLFGRDPWRFVCAVEMKSGFNLDAKHAVAQIQEGLAIAEANFAKDEVERWYPVLLHNCGAGNFFDKRFLLSNRAYVKFHGDRVRVELHECGSRLSDILGEG